MTQTNVTRGRGRTGPGVLINTSGGLLEQTLGLGDEAERLSPERGRVPVSFWFTEPYTQVWKCSDSEIGNDFSLIEKFST